MPTTNGKRLISKLVLVVIGLVMAFGSMMFVPLEVAMAYTDDYPSQWAYPHPLDSLTDTWLFSNRECVSFVAWRLSSRNGFNATGYQNAIDWKQEAISNGVSVNNTPAVGAVAWFSYGHVAYVTAVNGSNVDLEEYNYDYMGDYNQRINFPASSVTNFIHFKDTNKAVGDYDGDGKSNYAVYRESNGTWHYYAGGDNSYQYGSTGDIPAPGYYSGATKVDDAEFRPSNGTWYIRPQGGSGYSYSFGLSGDVPVPSDFDGTGKTNYAVWRPSDGSWHYYSGGDVAHGWGLPGDIPVPGHYSGAAKADYAVFRPSTATWYIQPQSGSSYTIAFGQSGDIPAPMIWDAGGKTEPGVFRPSNGTWYYWTPSGTVSHSYGLSGDIPTPGYFSGATKPDYAVFRPSDNSWYIQPQSGSAYSFTYGSTGDVPAIQVLPLPMLQYYGLHS